MTRPSSARRRGTGDIGPKASTGCSGAPPVAPGETAQRSRARRLASRRRAIVSDGSPAPDAAGGGLVGTGTLGGDGGGMGAAGRATGATIAGAASTWCRPDGRPRRRSRSTFPGREETLARGRPGGRRTAPPSRAGDPAAGDRQLPPADRDAPQRDVQRPQQQRQDEQQRPQVGVAVRGGQVVRPRIQGRCHDPRRRWPSEARRGTARPPRAGGTRRRSARPARSCARAPTIPVVSG